MTGVTAGHVPDTRLPDTSATLECTGWPNAEAVRYGEWRQPIMYGSYDPLQQGYGQQQAQIQSYGQQQAQMQGYGTSPYSSYIAQDQTWITEVIAPTCSPLPSEIHVPLPNGAFVRLATPQGAVPGERLHVYKEGNPFKG